MNRRGLRLALWLFSILSALVLWVAWCYAIHPDRFGLDSFGRQQVPPCWSFIFLTWGNFIQWASNWLGVWGLFALFVWTIHQADKDLAE